VSAARVHRVVIDSYPTPDGRPFDFQPQNDYETAVDLFHNPGAPYDCPAWLDGITLDDRLYTGDSGWRDGPLPGVTIFDTSHEPLLTVPVLRRVNFFSKAAAANRLALLTAWGAVGRVESSAPITWEPQP
jgi:hypothetical protein